MKTCEGRISVGVALAPIAKLTGYSISKTFSTSEKNFMDDGCVTRKTRQSAATQITVDGELDLTNASQSEIEDLEAGLITIFPENEVTGAAQWEFPECSTSTFNITGGSGADVTFQATLDVNGAVDKTKTVP